MTDIHTSLHKSENSCMWRSGSHSEGCVNPIFQCPKTKERSHASPSSTLWFLLPAWSWHPPDKARAKHSQPLEQSPFRLCLCQNQFCLLVSITQGCKTICGQTKQAEFFFLTSHLLYITCGCGLELSRRHENSSLASAAPGAPSDLLQEGSSAAIGNLLWNTAAEKY